jgi:hypothetical protein
MRQERHRCWTPQLTLQISSSWYRKNFVEKSRRTWPAPQQSLEYLHNLDFLLCKRETSQPKDEFLFAGRSHAEFNFSSFLSENVWVTIHHHNYQHCQGHQHHYHRVSLKSSPLPIRRSYLLRTNARVNKLYPWEHEVSSTDSCSCNCNWGSEE